MKTNLQKSHSPKITDYSWGHLEVDGKIHFKDAKLFPCRAKKWNWKKTGTSHSPGIQPADVEELITAGCEVIILSTGMDNRLQVCPETLELLKENNIETHVLSTDIAIKKYNKLRKKNRTGGLFHSTC